MAAIALAFVRETFALQTAACGIYLIGCGLRSDSDEKFHRYLNRRGFAFLMGLVLLIFGLLYFVFFSTWLIPRFSVALSGLGIGGLYSESFSWLGGGLAEIITSILSNPLTIAEEILTTPRKVIYLVALFGALAFVPILKPGPLVVALPILAISLLSRTDNYYGLGHHYTAGLIVPMIFAFAGGLPRARRIWQVLHIPKNWFRPALIIFLISAHIALSPSPIGRLFWSEKIWTYNYHAYIPTIREKMIKQAIQEHIPPDPGINISTQNTLNWAPLNRRVHFLVFPQ